MDARAVCAPERGRMRSIFLVPGQEGKGRQGRRMMQANAHSTTWILAENGSGRWIQCSRAWANARVVGSSRGLHLMSREHWTLTLITP